MLLYLEIAKLHKKGSFRGIVYTSNYYNGQRRAEILAWIKQSLTRLKDSLFVCMFTYRPHIYSCVCFSQAPVSRANSQFWSQ